QAVLDGLAADPSRAVYEDSDRVVRAGETADAVARAAAGLRGAGVAPRVGDALDLGVEPRALARTLHPLAVGARVCGPPPGRRPQQRAEVLARADVALVVDPPRLEHLLATPPDGPAVAAGRPGDPARITWTSGTSGRPKGCVHTYAGLTRAWAADPDRWPP